MEESDSNVCDYQQGPVLLAARQTPGSRKSPCLPMAGDHFG